jgi:hypothetical protein
MDRSGEGQAEGRDRQTWESDCNSKSLKAIKKAREGWGRDEGWER